MGIYLLILIGFGMLIYGGNMLVDGAVALAKRMHVSPLLIGLTLVGFGTSTPELMTSLFAAIQKAQGIAVGNVVGSNIANIFCILGVAAAISPIVINKKSFKRDGKFLLLSTMILIGGLFWGRIGFLLGAVMCGTLGYYVYYSYQTEQKHPQEESQETTSGHTKKCQKHELEISVLKTLLGIALTVLGADVLVTNAKMLATRWGVSDTIIGLTMVALGTSLPELMTSIVASLKKQGELAWGNVIGSNIYNALFVLGATALFVPVQVPTDVAADIGIMAGATALVMYYGHKGKLTRAAGGLLCALYIVYIAYIIFKA